MYNIIQISLKEYKIKNTDNVKDIYFIVYKFEKGEYIEVFELITLEPDGEYLVKLPSDGIFKIRVESDTDDLANVIISNITELLEVKQKFLTDILLRPKPDKCDHNQYYDLISFNIIFDTYNKLIKDTFTQAIVPEDQLYKADYLLSRLQEF